MPSSPAEARKLKLVFSRLLYKQGSRCYLRSFIQMRLWKIWKVKVRCKVQFCFSSKCFHKGGFFCSSISRGPDNLVISFVRLRSRVWASTSPMHMPAGIVWLLLIAAAWQRCPNHGSFLVTAVMEGLHGFLIVGGRSITGDWVLWNRSWKYNLERFFSMLKHSVSH